MNCKAESSTSLSELIPDEDSLLNIERNSIPTSTKIKLQNIDKSRRDGDNSTSTLSNNHNAFLRSFVENTETTSNAISIEDKQSNSTQLTNFSNSGSNSINSNNINYADILEPTGTITDWKSKQMNPEEIIIKLLNQVEQDRIQFSIYQKKIALLTTALQKSKSILCNMSESLQKVVDDNNVYYEKLNSLQKDQKDIKTEIYRLHTTNERSEARSDKYKNEIKAQMLENETKSLALEISKKKNKELSENLSKSKLGYSNLQKDFCNFKNKYNSLKNLYAKSINEKLEKSSQTLCDQSDIANYSSDAILSTNESIINDFKRFQNDIASSTDKMFAKIDTFQQDQSSKVNASFDSILKYHKKLDISTKSHINSHFNNMSSFLATIESKISDKANREDLRIIRDLVRKSNDNNLINHVFAVSETQEIKMLAIKNNKIIGKYNNLLLEVSNIRNDLLNCKTNFVRNIDSEKFEELMKFINKLSVDIALTARKDDGFRKLDDEIRPSKENNQKMLLKDSELSNKYDKRLIALNSKYEKNQELQNTNYKFGKEIMNQRKQNNTNLMRKELDRELEIVGMNVKQKAEKPNFERKAKDKRNIKVSTRIEVSAKSSIKSNRTQEANAQIASAVVSKEQQEKSSSNLPTSKRNKSRIEYSLQKEDAQPVNVSDASPKEISKNILRRSAIKRKNLESVNSVTISSTENKRVTRFQSLKRAKTFVNCLEKELDDTLSDDEIILQVANKSVDINFPNRRKSKMSLMDDNEPLDRLFYIKPKQKR